jgi:hypothetical protein
MRHSGPTDRRSFYGGNLSHVRRRPFYLLGMHLRIPWCKMLQNVPRNAVSTGLTMMTHHHNHFGTAALSCNHAWKLHCSVDCPRSHFVRHVGSATRASEKEPRPNCPPTPLNCIQHHVRTGSPCPPCRPNGNHLIQGVAPNSSAFPEGTIKGNEEEKGQNPKWTNHHSCTMLVCGLSSA